MLRDPTAEYRRSASVEARRSEVLQGKAARMNLNFCCRSFFPVPGLLTGTHLWSSPRTEGERTSAKEEVRPGAACRLHLTAVVRQTAQPSESPYCY
jgi:hypothetical protein